MFPEVPFSAVRHMTCILPTRASVHQGTSCQLQIWCGLRFLQQVLEIKVDIRSIRFRGLRYRVHDSGCLSPLRGSANIQLPLTIVKVYATARKSTQFHDTEKGTKASEIVMSLIEPAKANDLNPFQNYTSCYCSCRSTKILLQALSS